MRALPPTRIVFDARALGPDLYSVGLLARLRLATRQAGLELELCNTAGELRDLLAFLGLADALCLKPGRQAEQREQGLGVEEERELDDPAG
jgi:hypothetical protein